MHYFIISCLIIQLKQLQQSLSEKKKTKNANTETEDMVNGEEEAQAEKEDSSGEPQDLGELSFDLEPAARPNEEEIRMEMLQLFPGGESELLGGDSTTLFAITMLCVAEGYEQQV